MCTLSKVNMADSSLSESSSISWSDYLNFEAYYYYLKIMIGLMRLLVKSGPGDSNHQDEPIINCESHTSIKNPCAAAASIKKATNGECITL